MRFLGTCRSYQRMIVLVFLSLCAGLQTSAEEVPSLSEIRKEIIRFGLESDLLDLVKQLRQEKNTDFNADLIALAQDLKNSALQEQLFQFFLELKESGAENLALKWLADPPKGNNSLALLLVSYLTEIQSGSSKDLFRGMIENDNKVLAAACIRALGKLRAQEAGEELLRHLKNPDFEENLKTDLIWSLGEMNYQPAVEELLVEETDSQSQPAVRLVLIEALGKIGDARAFPVIQKSLTDPNVQIKVKAVAALEKFLGEGEILLSLVTALKDNQSQVRSAAAEVLAQLKNRDALDILLYRVKKDPDPKVQAASYKAVAVIDEARARETAAALLKEKTTHPELWKQVLTLALEKDWTETFPQVEALIKSESGVRNSPYAAQAALLAVGKKADELKGLYGLLLDDPSNGTKLLALRAIGLNGWSEFRPRVESLAKTVGPLQKQAQEILAQMAAF